MQNTSTTPPAKGASPAGVKPRFPGIRITTNGNQLVAYHTEARITEGGVFYPITPSTEMGENYQLAWAEGKLDVFGRSKIAIEAEGEHAAQGGAIAFSVCGRRTVNFTSGQGIVYGAEQYYHAPGKLSTMVVEVAARALTKHALNVHCGHDDIYAVLDTGWIMLFSKDAQQAADQALVLRRVTELSLTPGMNIQDGFLTSHLERTFYKHEADLLRLYLGAPDDVIDCPTDAQRQLFGKKRRRVPSMIDLRRPLMLGPVQNQEHYMNGVVARRNHFYEGVLPMLEAAWRELGDLTGRYYGPISHYRTADDQAGDAATVFVSLGSAAENIEAAVDLLRSRGEKVGSLHLNVIRPFPEAAAVQALAGRKNVIVLERTDEALAGDNPLSRDLRTALTKGLQNHSHPASDGVPALAPAAMPRLFSGVYGLGSRDFRPEGVLGAYEFATKGLARTDGKRAADGVHWFAIGIDHPYEVRSAERPSLLPHGAIAVRFHSIGGWGMITTGKNLGEVLGELGDHVSRQRNELDEFGRLKEVVHVSANPKYGSEKKGAPTEYFLVAAPERIRVNCDLRHVNVVLCCDPKAFLHTNPLDGLEQGGAFVWESDVDPAEAWRRIPRHRRKEILEREIRVFILPGFDIAQKASKRPELQLRMQGNAFLGAFFAVSPFLDEFGIAREHFLQVVEKQYQKKFGRLGESVVKSNMEVMRQGMERCTAVPHGAIDADDRSPLRGEALLPIGCGTGCGSGNANGQENGHQNGHTGGHAAGEHNGAPHLYHDADATVAQPERDPIHATATFDQEFRAGLGYHQPASVLASVGMMAPATGATSSKFVARRLTPVFHPENCTQCMACIAACPDTALPNTAQDIGKVLATAAQNYVGDPQDQKRLLAGTRQLESVVRAEMLSVVQQKGGALFHQLVAQALDQGAIAELQGISADSRRQFLGILEQVPLAYQKTTGVFAALEKKQPGGGGLFSIFVNDLCKGCGECVTECGDHKALSMAVETEAVNGHHATGSAFLDLLPDTPQKYLGLYDDQDAAGSREAALRNHLMVRRNYEALVSGDGACAGCGEKSVLRALASVTEAYMRPIFHKKAQRLQQKAEAMRTGGEARLQVLRERAPQEYALWKRTVAHLLLGLGGEDDKDTEARIAKAAPSDSALVQAIVMVMKQDAFNHRHLQPLDGRLDNGMSAMAMAAHTGCNTVFGSTPPSNPHPYPWMNSLFQDGATIGWLMGESFVMDHARRSVIPERLCDVLLERDRDVMRPGDDFAFTHFTDALMTDQEIAELPKVWVVGGDGGMGDIGYQNVSKVVLQNRPNVKMVMLDTQVYSNTGGQNSDSSLMPGGYDMNQVGAATQGKLTEKKGVAESFTMGHGSPYVAQVSMANAAKLYKSMLDALEYRGTAFLQCYTACQPEHGVADDLSTVEAQRVRDSRVMPEWTFHPGRGETRSEAFDLKGNPNLDRDWWETTLPGTTTKYRFTPAHFAIHEGRFRRHWKELAEDDARKLPHLDDMLARLAQDDVVNRRYLLAGHRAFVPDFGVVIQFADDQDRVKWAALSRQLVLFCVERRKSWRMLQSGAGVDNLDYRAQKALLGKVDKGELPLADFLAQSAPLARAEQERLAAEKKKPAVPAATK